MFFHTFKKITKTLQTPKICIIFFMTKQSSEYFTKILKCQEFFYEVKINMNKFMNLY